MRGLHRRMVAALATAAVAALVPVAPAFAAGSPSLSANVAAVGSAPALPYGAQTQGATPLDQGLSFDVVLKPRNQPALDAFVHQLSTPGTAQYRHFLTPGEYAATFGPTPQAIANVKSSLAALGLKVNSVSGSVVSVSGSVAQVGSALHTSFSQYRLRSGRVARANRSAPKLPLTVAPLVQSVVGLDTLVQLNHAPVRPQTIAPQTATFQTCLVPGSPADHYYNPDQLAAYYGHDSFYASNDFGAGVTVALFELEPFLSSDVNQYQHCNPTKTSVSAIAVDGGAGTGAGLEATLDIEGIVGLAPAARIKVYEAPNNGQGILDEYQAIANADAQVVSTSWGSCEDAADAAFYQSERAIFLQMAAQGQTVLAASGDSGSEACYQGDSGNKSLSVGDPASQPEVTGVGGTDLTDLSEPEQTWNDTGAGGGGVSAIWQMPSWQAPVAATGAPDGTECNQAAGAYCREVPDVSASASPNHGYAVYWSNPDPGSDGPGWYGGVGGTSAAAPTWAALIALVDSSCPGNRLGLINPALYQLESAGGAAFNDVIVGNNDFTGTQSGAFSAVAGYDMATGLGTPVGAAIGAGLCPALADPGAGTAVVDRTSVQAATDTTLTFTYALPANRGIANGELDIAVPSGWSTPSTTAANPGYVTASIGEVKPVGSTIVVKGITATAGSSITVAYGDTSGGGPGAVAPATARTDTFATSVKASASGSAAPVASSPQVQVWTLAAAGAGTMTVSPAAAFTGSTQPLTFTYAPPTGALLVNGEVTIAVPAGGWTAPQNATPGAAGYVTASTGTLTAGAETIDVTGVNLNLGATLTITYGAGAGASAPATAGRFTFTAAQGGAGLTASPTVTVAGNASDGAGSVASPPDVTTGSNAAIALTYKAPSDGYLTDGEITIDVPADWTSAPSTTSTDPGYTTAPGVTVNVSGQQIQVTHVNLPPNGTLLITYGSKASGGSGALVPGTAQTSPFAVKEKSTNAGSLTDVVPEPSVTVANPPPAGGGGGGGPIGGHPDLVRVSGADRIATSVAASNAAFAKDNSARVVVLARSDSFADALAGTPLAASKGGPLLLTPTAALNDATIGEISRVLPIGSTIYLLGGTSAISASIATTLSASGYTITRLAGADRYATAVAVAGALGNPGTVFEADGTNFPDALSAGTAAAQQGGVVLLTAGSKLPAATAGYLTAHPSVRYAVGGPAAKADPGAVPLVGPDRYATSVLVAQKFFAAPLSVGVASGVNFPDALSGGAVAGLNGGPMLLVPNTGAVSASTTNYLRAAGATASQAWLFGGTASINDGVFTQVASALKPPTP